jgi:hypothetical protein
MGPLDREFRLAHHRLAGRGDAVDGFTPDELAALHLVGEHVIRVADQQIRTAADSKSFAGTTLASFTLTGSTLFLWVDDRCKTVDTPEAEVARQ